MSTRIDLPALVLCLSLVGCGDDGAARTDAGDPSDAGGSDASTAGDAGAADAGDTPTDAGDGCTRVSLDGTWAIERDLDVSIGFAGQLSPVVDGTSGQLLVLFERYVEEAPVGTFDLGEEPNDNYGTCQQCVVVTGLTAESAFFADRGTLTTTVDPYTKRLAASLEGVRLVEVTVDPFTRESTPIDGGRCIELVDAEVDQKFAPEGWTCDVDSYADGAACHCECGAWDLDCGTCDPYFDPECEDLPVADCGDGDICGFDPVAGSTACVEACDWAGGVGCDAGVCVFDFGVEGQSVCFTDAERIDTAVVGEECGVSYLQKVCNVVDGFARGFCDEASVCRPLCESDDECTVAGESCRLFVLGTPLGFCGPPPSDDDG